MLIDINDIGKYNFALSEINLIDNLLFKQKVIEKHQKRNTLIYILGGKLRIEADGEESIFSSDAIIYFPPGGIRKMIVEEHPIHYYRIDFALKIDGEVVFFSNTPSRINGFSVTSFRTAAKELNEVCQKTKDMLLKIEKMCKLLSVISKSEKKQPNPRLEPAVAYLNSHYTEKIDCRDLAAMCFLSTAQFYNLFNESFNMTPLEYRNKLILKRAEDLISSGDSTIGEVASNLGFADAAYFSRFFKRHMGISPATYAKQKS